MSRIASENVFPQGYLLDDHPGILNKSIDRFDIYCRIRHFLDVHGYALGRHNDSLDTYCALIAPILPGSTSTSIMAGSSFNREIFKESVEQSPGQLHQNDFCNGACYANIERGAYVEYLSSRSSTKYTASFPYSIHQSDVRAGEIFAIPNPLWVACNLKANEACPEVKTVSHFLGKFGHGLFPAVVEPYRPVLLVDYVFRKSQSVPVETDERIMINLGRARDVMRFGL